MTGARTILAKCLGLRENESFLLVFDETTRDFPPIFKSTARKLGIHYHQAFVSTDLQARGLAAFRSHLSKALTGARAVLVATTDDERCTGFRIRLTSEKRNASSAIATMPGASMSILKTAIDIDYDQIIARCRDLTLPLIKGSTCEIKTFDSSGREYSLKFKLPGFKRPPIQSYGIIPRQAWGNIPAGETFIAPLEDSAYGEYLVTGAVGTEKIRKGNEALLRFEQGRLVKHNYLHSGKPVAHLKRLQLIAEASGQGHCWSTIAEFGIGVNDAIRRLVGIQLVDEKKYGTVHIAVGHNYGYGGATNCGSVHCDITTSAPTVLIDEKILIERGNHVTDFSSFKDNFRRDRATFKKQWEKGSKVVHLIEDSYELDSSHTLWVKKRTSSGRLSIYAVGDDETTQLAYRVVDHFRGHPTVKVEALRRSLDISQIDCEKILTVLLNARIVSA